MGSFFKNLLKNNNQKIDKNSKKLSKWLFIFKKTHDQTDNDADYNNLITGQENNQGMLKISNSASSLRSNYVSENNCQSDSILFLPGMKNYCFKIPKFIPSSDWIRSQVFEVIHMLLSFTDLIYQRNITLYKDFDFQLDRIVKLIDDHNIDLKSIFVEIIEIESRLYDEEIKLWMELKIEAHLNSLIGQTLALCSHLPENQFYDVIESLNIKESILNFSAYKKSLDREESNSLSQQGSDLSSSLEKIQ